MQKLLLALVAACLTLAATSVAHANHAPALLEHASNGPNANTSVTPTFDAISQDGSRVIFDTVEQVTPDDTDGSRDIYLRSGGTTSLVSTSATAPGSSEPATFLAASADGVFIFFSTTEALTPDDTDSQLDFYVRVANASPFTILFTPDTDAGMLFSGISQDGSHLFFRTDEQVLPEEDMDSAVDVYERFNGETKLVSIGEVGGNGAQPVTFATPNADGTRVFFQTQEKLTTTDNDVGFEDVYQRFGGSTTLVSTSDTNADASGPATFAGASPDGTKVFLHTTIQFDVADSDTVQDVYLRANFATTKISAGNAGGRDATFLGASDDATHAFYRTEEAVLPADNDGGMRDFYEYFNGSTSLVTGPAAVNVAVEPTWGAISTDGTRAFFHTDESLLASDTDTARDVYQWSNGVLTRVSLGSLGGNDSARPASFAGASRDGNKVFFSTPEALEPGDADGGFNDVYERTRGSTSRISLSLTGGNGAGQAFFQRATPDGSRVVFISPEQLRTSDTDGANDLYVAVEGGYARPQGAAALRVPLAIAHEECGDDESANRTHGPALSFPSCNPAVQASTHLTVGHPDNGKTAQFAGFAKMNVCPSGTTAAGACSTPAGMDAPDVRLEVSVTDVRRQAGLTDYTGELLADLGLRITDRHNGPSETESATVSDIPLDFPVPCSTTENGDVGSSCAVVTRVNVVTPGAVAAGTRGNWELAPIELYDGGADDDAETQDNTLFASQGLFIP